MFDFDKYWSLVLQFLTNNLYVTIGIAIVLLIFFYKKPVEAIKFLGFCALLVTVLYVMSLLSESGGQGVFQKKGMTTKSETELMK